MKPSDFQDEVNKDNEAKKSEQDKANLTGAINKAGVKNVQATNANAESTSKALKDVRGKVEVTNPDLAKSDDMSKVVDSINKMNVTTFMGTTGFHDMAENMSRLSEEVQTLQDKLESEGLTNISSSFSTLVDKLNTTAKTLSGTKVQVDSSIQKTLEGLRKSIDGIDFNPQVNVSSPETKVVTTPVDLKPVVAALGQVETAIKNSQPEDKEEVDFSPVIDGLNSVKNAIQNQTFPVPNYVLPFKDSQGRATQVQLDASGNLPTAGGSGGGGTQYVEGVTTSPATGTVALGRYNTSPPTLTNGQLNAPQLDANGNLKIAIASGGGSGGTASSFGAAFPATGTAIGLSNGTNMVALLQGQTTMSASIPVTLASNQTSIPVAATLSAETTKVIGTVNQGTSPWVVSGTVTANAGTGNFTVTQATGTNLHAVLDSGTLTTLTTLTGTTSLTPGVAATNLGKAEDAIHASGDTGVMALGVSNVAQSTLNADGDYSVLATDTKGNQYAAMRDTLGNATNSAANGFLKVTDEPKQVFYDSFDASPDTVNMWTSTTGSSGVAASVTTGVLSMGTGTVANGYSKFTSIPTFKPVIPGWVVFSDAILIPDAASPTANALRLWGTGTTPGTPTFAAPVTDGYFFELSGSTLSAVVYAGGTRTQIATGLTLATTYQRYIIQVRTDRTFFYIGTIDSAGLVATTNFQSPQAQVLPKTFLAVGNSTPPGSNSQIQCTGAVVSDTGKNATLIADGTFPWRRASVSSAGSLSVSTTSDVPGTGATNLGKAEDAVHTSGDTGVMALAVANEALTNISGTDGDYTIIGSDRNGTIHVAQKASTATLSNVAASASSVTLLSANAARIGAQITNDSSAVVYIKFGTTASTTSYTVSLAGAASAPFSYYEIPAGYTGRIDAISASATGNLRITEITP